MMEYSANKMLPLLLALLFILSVSSEIVAGGEELDASRSNENSCSCGIPNSGLELNIASGSALAAIKQLLRNGHLLTSVEELEGEAGRERLIKHLGERRLSARIASSSIRDALAAIMAGDDGYSWRFDGCIINFISRELEKIDDNPFDIKIDGFEFEGNSEDFMTQMNSMVPELMTVTFWEDRPFEKRNVAIELSGRVTVRSAINSFARAANVGWVASVRKKPVIWRITEGPDSGREIGSHRTMFAFTPGRRCLSAIRYTDPQ